MLFKFDPQTLLKQIHKCYSNLTHTRYSKLLKISQKWPTNVIQIWSTNVTQINPHVTQIDSQTLVKLIHKCYLIWHTRVTQIDSQTLLKITLNRPTSVTQVDPQDYLKHYSKLVLKVLVNLKIYF